MADLERLSTPLVGKPRPKRHPTIVRHEVGKAPRRFCGLDFTPDRTFGAYCRRDAEGAGDVILSWKVHTPNKENTSLREKNFMSLNKKATGAKCSTPKDITAFRKVQPSVQYKRIASPSPNRLPTDLSNLINNNGLSFGAPTEKSDKVKDLITHKFACDWIHSQTEKQQQLQRKKAEGVSRNHRKYIHPPKTLVTDCENDFGVLNLVTVCDFINKIIIHS